MPNSEFERSYNRLTSLQIRLKAFGPTSFRILSRRDAHNSLKSALQIKGTEPQLLPQRLEVQAFILIRLDQATCAAHHRHLAIVKSRLFGFTAATSAKSSGLSCFRQVEKCYSIAPRPPRRARRPAIDSSRLHSEYKAAVKARVFRQYSSPHFFRLVFPHVNLLIQN